MLTLLIIYFAVAAALAVGATINLGVALLEWGEIRHDRPSARRYAVAKDVVRAVRILLTVPLFWPIALVVGGIWLYREISADLKEGDR